MPRHATKTSFKPGDKRLGRGTPLRAAQSRTIAKLVANGTWTSQRPEVRAKLSVPCPAKASNYNSLPVGTKRLWNGAKYIVVKIAEPNKWEYEHRLVAEAKIGRSLTSNEHVHHLNCDTHDNRAENLVVMSRSAHAALPRKSNGHPRCPTCGYNHPPH